MKKINVTRKMIERENDYVLCVGYCDLYNLLKCIDRIGYNSGVYGWNYDYYRIYIENFGYVAITTGYRPIGNIVTNNRDLNRKYDLKAVEIWRENGKFEEQRQKVEDLLIEYIKEVLK